MYPNGSITFALYTGISPLGTSCLLRTRFPIDTSNLLESARLSLPPY